MRAVGALGLVLSVLSLAFLLFTIDTGVRQQGCIRVGRLLVCCVGIDHVRRHDPRASSVGQAGLDVFGLAPL